MSMGIEVLGGAAMSAQITAIMEYAFSVADEELEKAAQLGADFTRAIAPYESGAYRYGGVSLSGTAVPNGITHTKVGEHQFAWGTPAPYGRVLELGYYGVDAAGRSRANPPKPHFTLSMPVVADFFIGNMITRGFKR
jgi:hypothetical protein